MMALEPPKGARRSPEWGVVAHRAAFFARRGMADSIVPWVDGLTIGAVLRRTARRHPDRDAMVFPSLDHNERFRSPDTSDSQRRDCFRVSYRQMDELVDRVARALLAIGIRKGDHVACWATNWPRWVLLQYATARIGAVMVMINPAYRTSELAYVLKQSDSVAFFLFSPFRSSDYFAMLTEAVPELRSSVPFPLLPS